MSYSAPPPRRGCSGCSPGRRCRYENQLWTAVRRPMRPDATSSRTATHDGWRRYMNASISRTPARSAASIIRSRIGRGQGQRLLAQDVLAGLARRRSPTRRAGGSEAGCRPRRPPGRPGAPRTSRAPWGCRARRPRRAASAGVARGDGDDLAVRRRAGSPGSPSAGDVGGRQDPPAQPSHRSHRPSSCDPFLTGGRGDGRVYGNIWMRGTQTSCSRLARWSVSAARRCGDRT